MRHTLVAVIMVLGMVLMSQTTFAVTVIDVPYTDDFMFVDGILDEGAWDEAVRLLVCADPDMNGCDNDPRGVKGHPPPGDYYVVKFLHDGFMLYMAVEAHVSEVAAASPNTVFSTGIPELLIKVNGESRNVPYRLTWVDSQVGVGPRVTESSMWHWAPHTGEWAFSLMDGTVPNSGQPGTGYILETSISLFELGYLDEEPLIPFSLVLFNYVAPIGGDWTAQGAQWSRYELGAFQTLAESSDANLTHAWKLLP